MGAQRQLIEAVPGLYLARQQATGCWSTAVGLARRGLCASCAIFLLLGGGLLESRHKRGAKQWQRACHRPGELLRAVISSESW